MQNHRPNQSRPSFLANGAKVRSQPSYRMVLHEATVSVTTNSEGVPERKIEFNQIRSIPLMNGLGIEAAKRSCDVKQEELDRECKPVRVYLYPGKDPVPMYAGLSGVSN